MKLSRQKEIAPASEPSDFDKMIAVISQAAANPDVDPSKMQQILDIQMTIMDRNAKQAFAASMAACQKEMPNIVRDAENTQTNSTYAKHEAICKAIKPIYTAHGFSLSFHEGKADHDNEIRTICDVEHSQGFSKQYHIDLPLDNVGIQGKVNKTGVHGKASTFSYSRRYLTMMIFDLATYDDNDANFAELITEDQAQALRKEAQDAEVYTAFMNWVRKTLKVDELEEVHAKRYGMVKDRLQSAIDARTGK